MKKSKKKQYIPIEEPSGINVPQLIFAIKKNRLWFVLFALLGLTTALVYNNLVPQKYKVLTTLLIKSDNSQATLTSVRPELQEDKKGVTVQDQVGVLSSFTLNYQTLQYLRWGITWAKKGWFKTEELYKNAPLKLDTTAKSFQVKDIPVRIKVLNNQEYNVDCNSTTEVNGDKHKVAFIQKGRFGQRFKNDYFDFTLNKIPGRLVDAGEEFSLTFNDLTQLAKSYQEELKISTGDDGSNLVTIELVSPQPVKAIDYLAQLDKVYIQYGLTEKNRRAVNTVKFINTQIAGIADSLQSSGNEVTNYRASNDVIDINQQSSSVVTNLSKVQGDVASATMQLDYFKGLKQYLMNAETMKSVMAPSVVGVTDPALNASVIKLGDLYHQRQVLSQTAQDQSPQMISLDNDIKYTQQAIKENVDNLIHNANAQLSNLSRLQQTINAEKENIPKKEQNLNKIKRNFDFNNALYSYLLQKRSEAQIAQASRDPDAQILDEASMGTAYLKGFKHPVNLLIGLLLGMLLPLVYLTARTFFKNKLVYIEDVKLQLRPSIVGTILHNKFENELPVMLFPHSEITESFRSLRININSLIQHLDRKVISVHSSIAGEGKTFVSSNLAAIIALNNKKVLLIDADLRQPRTHHIFSGHNKNGLSNYLQGEVDFDSIITPTQINGLDLVSSGPKPDYPGELLGNHFMEGFMAEAKARYEYVIINNAPLNIVKDGMMMAPYSDVNLFLLRINKSSVNQLKYINDLIQEGVVKNVVVALNNVTADSYAINSPTNHGYYNDNRMLRLN